MSEASVSVLGPNGRRTIVKCTPNTTILQILEDACKKQKLSPEEFDLKHHNKIMDITATFRFSGLPNNAQLEMVKAVKVRLESEVTLAINLEDGTRLMGNFHPGETLVEILSKLCPEKSSLDKNPVIVYTRREIYGEELKNVTLKSLGITGGRAMLRLMNKAPEELKIQANVAAPLPHKPTEEKPYVRKLKKIQDFDEKEKKDEGNEKKTDDYCAGKEKMEVEPKEKKVEINQRADFLKLAKEKRKSADVESSTKKDKKSSVGQKLGTAQKENIEMEVEINDKKPIEEEFVFLGERNAMLFSLETAHSIPTEDLPDDFFELTINDARKLLRDVRKQQQGMENAPLLTSNLRQLEDTKKQLRSINKYKKAIIRVQFPDRTVLQGTFLPSDTVQTVFEFIREYLDDKNCQFHVYTTPPKNILDKSKTLLELGFVPGALIHFGSDSNVTNFLRKDLQNKFTSNSIASLAAYKMRNEFTRKDAKDMEEDEEEVMDYEMNSVDDSNVNAGASTSTGITHGEKKIVKTPDGKVPKWFKP